MSAVTGGDGCVIRPFEEKDAGKVGELWNACLPYDPTTQEKLLQLRRQPTYDPHGFFVSESDGEIIEFLPKKNKRYVEQNGDPKDRILALREGEVVGYINFRVSGADGYISQTGVLPALRRKRIGSALVFRAISDMQSRGATHLSIVWCP